MKNIKNMFEFLNEGIENDDLIKNININLVIEEEYLLIMDENKILNILKHYLKEYNLSGYITYIGQGSFKFDLKGNSKDVKNYFNFIYNLHRTKKFPEFLTENMF